MDKARRTRMQICGELLEVDRNNSPLDFAVKLRQNFKGRKGHSDPWSGLADIGFCVSVLEPL